MPSSDLAPGGPATAARPPARWRRRLANLLATALGVALAWLVAEGVLHVYYPFQFRARGRDIQLPCHLTYRIHNPGLPGLDATISHTKNSLGFRGPELPPADAARPRVFAVGGSTTECFYLSDGRTWPELVAGRLQAAGQPVWLNNAGLDGHSTFGHRVLLERHLLALNPDVIVFLVGANDVGRTDLNRDDNKAALVRLTGVRELALKAALYLRTVDLAVNLARVAKARHQRLVHQALDLKALPVADRDLPVDLAALRRAEAACLAGYAARLAGLVALCRANRVTPVLMTQPSLFGCATDPTTGLDLSRRLSGSETLCCQWQRLELYNDEVRKLCREQAVPLIDTAALMEHDSRYFYDGSHFTNAGAARVGELAANGLRPVLDHLAQTRPALRPGPPAPNASPAANPGTATAPEHR